jgi:hypothetical protein
MYDKNQKIIMIQSWKKCQKIVKKLLISCQKGVKKVVKKVSKSCQDVSKKMWYDFENWV